jgi:hypothetical protein
MVNANFPAGAKRNRSAKPIYEAHNQKHYFLVKLDKILLVMVQETEDNVVIANTIEFMEKLQKQLNLSVLFESLGQ